MQRNLTASVVADIERVCAEQLGKICTPLLKLTAAIAAAGAGAHSVSAASGVTQKDRGSEESKAQETVGYNSISATATTSSTSLSSTSPEALNELISAHSHPVASAATAREYTLKQLHRVNKHLQNMLLFRRDKLLRAEFAAKTAWQALTAQCLPSANRVMKTGTAKVRYENILAKSPVVISGLQLAAALFSSVLNMFHSHNIFLLLTG